MFDFLLTVYFPFLGFSVVRASFCFFTLDIGHWEIFVSVSVCKVQEYCLSKKNQIRSLSFLLLSFYFLFIPGLKSSHKNSFHFKIHENRHSWFNFKPSNYRDFSLIATWPCSLFRFFLLLIFFIERKETLRRKLTNVRCKKKTK